MFPFQAQLDALKKMVSEWLFARSWPNYLSKRKRKLNAQWVPQRADRTRIPPKWRRTSPMLNICWNCLPINLPTCKGVQICQLVSPTSLSRKLKLRRWMKSLKRRELSAWNRATRTCRLAISSHWIGFVLKVWPTLKRLQLLNVFQVKLFWALLYFQYDFSKLFLVFVDPAVTQTLEKMLAMGFKDDGGWLTRYLEKKGGNIDDILKLFNLCQ